jgi:hypothetical protein
LLLLVLARVKVLEGGLAELLLLLRRVHEHLLLLELHLLLLMLLILGVKIWVVLVLQLLLLGYAAALQRSSFASSWRAASPCAEQPAPGRFCSADLRFGPS